MNQEQQLRDLIEKEFNKCCQTSLPRFKKAISTDAGRERMADVVFEMCSANGYAVQTAMSLLDSDL